MNRARGTARVREQRPGERAARPGGAIVNVEDVAVLREDVLMLDHADLRAHPGEVLALTGANGSGKTTLLRVIAGMLRPTTGRVTVDGRVPDDRDPAFRTALAALIGPPQTARDLTLEEHLRFIAATWSIPASRATAQAAELLDALQIDSLAHRFAHELSSGQTQLAALAMTLARPARVLLLDEPEQRLDADRLDLVAELLRSRTEAGCAIIMASHSPRLVSALADATVHLEATW